MNPSTIAHLARTGAINMVNKYCSASLTAILVYDYFLTLDREVQYNMPGEGGRLGVTLFETFTHKLEQMAHDRPVFYLFILNRYLPLANNALGIASNNFSVELFYQMCKGATTAQLSFFVLSSFLAHIFIGVRAYALSRLSKKLLWTFLVLGVVNIGLGIVVIYEGYGRVVSTPNIPLDPFKLCLYEHNESVGIAFGVSAIVFDMIALVSTVIQVLKYVRHFPLSSMLRAVICDVTIYFFTIFLSHVLLVATMETARPGLKLLPAIGLEVLMPVMTSRLVLSLKEVADQTAAESTNGRSFTMMSFSARFSTRELSSDLDASTYADDRALPLRARRRQASPDSNVE